MANHRTTSLNTTISPCSQSGGGDVENIPHHHQITNQLKFTIMRKRRYVMAFSAAEYANMVVYATCLSEAMRLFEDGIFFLEHL